MVSILIPDANLDALRVIRYAASRSPRPRRAFTSVQWTVVAWHRNAKTGILPMRPLSVEPELTC